MESLDISRARGRAASGFRPKLQRRAESLSLESLDMSCAVDHESLDIPKFHESLDMVRKNLDIRKLGRKSLDHFVLEYLAFACSFILFLVNSVRLKFELNVRT